MSFRFTGGWRPATTYRVIDTRDRSVFDAYNSHVAAINAAIFCNNNLRLAGHQPAYIAQPHTVYQ